MMAGSHPLTGVTAPAGFTASGVAAGILDGRDDVALVAAGTSVAAAGLFTTHQAPAAPVIVSREHLVAGATARAVVLNAGCANAGTGTLGIAAARAVAADAARLLGATVGEVLVCSTGPIGPALPVERLRAALPGAVARLAAGAMAGRAAAGAILTTDTRPKQTAVRGDGFTVGGMAKGAGMVRPDLATMLVVLTTDAVAAAPMLEAALRRATERTFHGLDIDGCQSPNDSVVLLASGASGVAPDGEALSDAVGAACRDLARQLVADAEGASRVVTLRVAGAESDEAARRLGRAMADSALVRAALFGGDANWGRLLGAAGASSDRIDPAAFAVCFQGVEVARLGVEVAHDSESVARMLTAREVTVEVTVGRGPGRAEVLTADLTPDYVHFNAERS